MPKKYLPRYQKNKDEQKADAENPRNKRGERQLRKAADQISDILRGYRDDAEKAVEQSYNVVETVRNFGRNLER